MNQDQMSRMLLLTAQLNGLTLVRIQSVENILKLLVAVLDQTDRSVGAQLVTTLKNLANSDHLTMNRLLRDRLVDFACWIQGDGTSSFDGIFRLSPNQQDRCELPTQDEIQKSFESLMREIENDQQ